MIRQLGHGENKYSIYHGIDSGLKPKDLCLIPQRLAIALQEDGWWVRSMIPWVKRSPMPESVTDRPTNALEYILMLTKDSRYFFDMEAVRMGFADDRMGNPGGGGQWARDCPYPDRRMDQQSGLQRGIWNEDGKHTGRAFRNSDLWFASIAPPHGLVGMGDELVGLDVTSDPTKFAHFATFPRALVEPLVKCSTSEAGVCSKCGKQWTRRVEKTTIGGIYKVGAKAVGHYGGQGTSTSTLGSILPHNQRAPKTNTLGWTATCTCTAEAVPATVVDPFAGSLTTLAVARDLGRRSVGIELSESYCEMGVKHRILGAPYKPESVPLALLEEPAQTRQMRMEEE